MALKTSIRPFASLNIFSLSATQQAESTYDEELAAEIACYAHEHTADQPIPDIDPDDFEKLYRWFLT